MAKRGINCIENYILKEVKTMKIYGSQGHSASCRAALGSVTLAMRAKRALAASQIACDVIKVSSGNSARGCVYGIEYPCEQSGSVISILAASGIQTR